MKCRLRAVGSGSTMLDGQEASVDKNGFGVCPFADAAERLAQAYDLLFSKTGRKQLGAAEVSDEDDEQKGRRADPV